MSHEIRTPLHAIVGAGNFLAEGNPRPGQHELIEALRGAADDLLNLTNGLLDLSKADAGQLKLVIEPFDVLHHLRRAEATYRMLCRQKGIELRVRYPDPVPPPLLGDSARIKQVLTNLVGNAVKFTERGSVELVLQCEPLTPERYAITFMVSDTGIGISPDRLEAIFNPFEQAEDTTERRYGGTGLGLAISQRIVHAYGSELDVRSTPGEGTTFSFRLELPVAGVPLETLPTSGRDLSSPLSPVPIRGLRVLNVDDSRPNLLINARHFRNWEPDFTQVQSGSEALQQLREATFDVVLLDLRMPDMDGYELARNIRRGEAGAGVRDVPLVALTASSSRDVSERMRQAGIDALVPKPFAPAELYNVLANYAEQLPPPPPETLVDFREVREVFDHDTEDLAAFYRVVVHDLLEFERGLKAAVAERDVPELRAAAHKITTSLRLFGFERTHSTLQLLARELEAGVTPAETLGRVRADVTVLVDALRGELAEAGVAGE